MEALRRKVMVGLLASRLGTLGLVGAILFEVGGAVFGLDRDMPAYAALVPPIYLTVFALSVAAAAALARGGAEDERLGRLGAVSPGRFA